MTVASPCPNGGGSAASWQWPPEGRGCGGMSGVNAEASFSVRSMTGWGTGNPCLLPTWGWRLDYLECDPT